MFERMLIKFFIIFLIIFYLISFLDIKNYSKSIDALKSSKFLNNALSLKREKL